jgi:WD40 repeat protein
MSRLLACLAALLGFVPPVPAQPKGGDLPPGAVARLGAVRYHNVGRVFSVACSPDGRTLLAGAWDGSIRLWDVATRQELRRYAGHTGWVRTLAFSPDGKTFASGGKDRVIRLWETSTGREIRRLEGHRNWVQYLAFSPDGKTLASRSTGLTLRLWDVTAGQEVRRVDLHPDTNASLAFSPDGHLLAYPGDVHSITLLDLATGKGVRQITRPRSWFADLVFSPDGKALIAISSDHTLHRWDPATGKELRPLGQLKEDAGLGLSHGLVLSPDGKSFAAAEEDHTIRVWEVSTRGERVRFRSPDKRPTALAWTPDGRILAQGSEDVSVLLWDLGGLRERGRRPGPLSPKELQARWADLAGADAAAGYRAIGTLAAGPGQGVPFIREHLRPASPVDVRTVTRLVAELDSGRFETRTEATEQLEKLRELAEPALRDALRGKPPLERRRRIERLLERVAAEREAPPPDRLRMLRALELLERIGTPEARQLLQQLAEGAPAAWLTREAKASLQRLARRSADLR